MVRQLLIAWLPLGAAIDSKNEKPRLHPKTPTGSFMLSPLARLQHLDRKPTDWSFVPPCQWFFASSAKSAFRFSIQRKARSDRAWLCRARAALQFQNEGRLNPLQALPSVVA